MLICNCTLGIDNPEACKRCSAYIAEYGKLTTTEFTDYNWWYSLEKLNTYNPETHELVEKKDAKLNRLRKEVEQLQNLFEFEYKVLNERIDSLAERKEELDKLKKELEAEENS